MLPIKIGSLFLAHPKLDDPNFRRTVILIFTYEPDKGAQGFILSRPLKKKLADVSPDFVGTPLADTPVFFGGPVDPESFFLLGMESKDGELLFHFFHNPNEAVSATNAGIRVMAFLGCSAWIQGQLEIECSNHDWIQSPIPITNAIEADFTEFWGRIVSRMSPQWKLIADAPDDSSLN